MYGICLRRCQDWSPTTAPKCTGSCRSRRRVTSSYRWGVTSTGSSRDPPSGSPCRSSQLTSTLGRGLTPASWRSRRAPTSSNLYSCWHGLIRAHEGPMRAASCPEVMVRFQAHLLFASNHMGQRHYL